MLGALGPGPGAKVRRPRWVHASPRACTAVQYVRCAHLHFCEHARARARSLALCLSITIQGNLVRSRKRTGARRSSAAVSTESAARAALQNVADVGRPEETSSMEPVCACVACACACASACVSRMSGRDFVHGTGVFLRDSLEYTHTGVQRTREPATAEHGPRRTGVCIWHGIWPPLCVCVCGVWQPLSMVHVAQSMLITTSFAAEVQVWGRPPANARSGAAGQRDADDD